MATKLLQCDCLDLNMDPGPDRIRHYPAYPASGTNEAAMGVAIGTTLRHPVEWLLSKHHNALLRLHGWLGLPGVHCLVSRSTLPAPPQRRRPGTRAFGKHRSRIDCRTCRKPVKTPYCGADPAQERRRIDGRG